MTNRLIPPSLIAVPPSDPVIYDEDGVEVDHELGPYSEDASVNITCEVEGGTPREQTDH